MAQRQFRGDDTHPWIDRYGDGGDGSKTVSSSETYDGARAGVSGSLTPGGFGLPVDAASSFADGDLVMIHQSRGSNAGVWELNKIASGGGTTNLVLTYPILNYYVDDGGSNQAQVMEGKEYSSLSINGSQVWSAPAWDGNTGGILFAFCSGTITITGTTSGNALGFRGGAGGPASSTGTTSCKSLQGEGTAAAGDYQYESNGNGGGGSTGSGSDGGNGGGGGGNVSDGTNGQAGQASTSIGGVSVGLANLTIAPFGGGGGGGRGEKNGFGDGGGGGDGGAFTVLIGKTITVSGGIQSNGEVGTAGTPIATEGGGGGGGGAGGPILIKGQNITLGSNLVTSTGGGGGLKGGSASGDGGGGSEGRIAVEYSDSISGTTSPTATLRKDEYLSDVFAHEGVFAPIKTHFIMQQNRHKRIKRYYDTLYLLSGNTSPAINTFHVAKTKTFLYDIFNYVSKTKQFLYSIGGKTARQNYSFKELGTQLWTEAPKENPTAFINVPPVNPSAALLTEGGLPILTESATNLLTE